MDKNVEQRKQLRAFADRMEQILTENDHKGGWEGCTPGWLLGRAEDELKEAKRAFKKFLATNVTDHASAYDAMREWQNELVDVANFCMMAWDQLEETIRSRPSHKS